MIVFFDTSALIKIYLEEAGSVAARELWHRSTMVIGSVLLYPEMHATFARKAREGAERAKIFTARNAFDVDWLTFLRVPIDDEIFTICRRLIDSHPLRGADAVHLASAARAQESLGIPLRFACADERLCAAAKLEHLEIENSH